MKKRFSLFPLFSALQLLVGTAVYAQDHTLEQLDTDKDGKISIKEAVADPVILASFGKIDTDGNGELSKEEFAAAKLTKESKD